MSFNYTTHLQDYLQEKAVDIIRTEGGELVIHCLFNNCDKDSRGKEAHLYINSTTGQFHCKKCDSSGGIKKLRGHFGDIESEEAIKQPKRNFTQSLVEECFRNMPEEIRTYLHSRGISDEIIEQQKLGYGQFYGSGWITIPMRPHGEMEYTHFLLRKDPENTNLKTPKTLSYPSKKSGAKTESMLYGEYVQGDEDLIICEGLLDCLSLLSLGVKALTSTGGASTFKNEWLIPELLMAKRIFVGYDNDDAGRKGADKVLRLLREAGYKKLHRIILPQEVGQKGDVNDYIAKLKLPAADLYTVYAESFPKPIDTTQFKEMTLSELDEVLSLTIKGDTVNKAITFLAFVSAFTEENQFNVMFNSPSSTGKTFVPLEISQLFPKDSLIKLGGCSPTAFFHDTNNKYDKETNTNLVNLERKIVVFMENPSTDVLKRLRPIISHDEKEISYKTTDKSEKGGNRTKNTIVRGYSSFIFCTASLHSDQQEKTRFIMLSPEITNEKIIAGVKRVIEKEKGSGKYIKRIESDSARIQLSMRIKAIQNAEIQNIYINENDSEYLEKLFFATVGNLQPRHLRDIQRVVSIAKAYALLNLWHRDLQGCDITVNRVDIDTAFELYAPIATTQSIGIAPYLHQLYLTIVIPCFLENKIASNNMFFEGIRYQDILNYHFKKRGHKLDFNYLRQQIMPEFEACGFVEKSVSGNRVYFNVVDCVSEDTPSSEEESGVK